MGLPMRIPDPRWNKVDWSKPDPLIAEEMGVSRQAVWEARRKRRISTVSAWVYKKQQDNKPATPAKRASKTAKKSKTSKTSKSRRK